MANEQEEDKVTKIVQLKGRLKDLFRSWEPTQVFGAEYNIADEEDFKKKVRDFFPGRKVQFMKRLNYMAIKAPRALKPEELETLKTRSM